jgi:hypothetical protein
MGPAPGEVRVGLDAADEVLEALVLDGARVPWRRVKAVERHGLHNEGFNLSSHLARARNWGGSTVPAPALAEISPAPSRVGLVRTCQRGSQSMRAGKNTCQASADLAVRLRKMYVASPNR